MKPLVNLALAIVGRGPRPAPSPLVEAFIHLAGMLHDLEQRGEKDSRDYLAIESAWLGLVRDMTPEQKADLLGRKFPMPAGLQPAFEAGSEAL